MNREKASPYMTGGNPTTTFPRVEHETLVDMMAENQS